MRSRKSLAVNATLNTIKTVVGMLLSLLTFPYVTRTLGATSLGAYNFSYSIVSYAVLFAGLGTAAYAIREGTQYRDNDEKMCQFVSEVFSINMWATILSYIVLLLITFGASSLQEYRSLIIILSFEIVGTTIGVSWLSNIYEDFLYITVRTLGFQVLYILCLFVFVHTPDDLYKYVVIIMVTNSGTNILNYFYLRKKYVKFKFTIHCNWRQHLKPILIIFSTKMAISIYVSSDKTVLGLLTNDTEVGLYSTAVKIYSIVKDVLTAIVTVLIPRFSLMLRRESRNEVNVFFSRVFMVLSLFLIPSAIGLFMMGQEVIFTIAGIEYLSATTALQILSIATIFAMYAQIFTNCILLPLRKENIVFWGTIISAIVNIVLNFIMIPYLGMNAAAITTVLAEFIIFILSVWFARNDIKIVSIKKDMLGILISCMGIVCTCLLVKEIVSNLFMRLVLAVGF